MLETLLDMSTRDLLLRARGPVKLGAPLEESSGKHPLVLVLSTGRTGTQTLAALLRLGRGLAVYHEPRPLLYGLHRPAFLHGDEGGAREVLKAAFLTARGDRIRHAFARGRGYVETSPQVTYLAPAALDALPLTRFVHLVRHPAAVVRSAMSRKWYNGHPYDAARLTPHPESEAGRRWGDYSPFQKNLWLWDVTNRWILRFLREVPQEQRQILRSEDLFAGKEETLRALFTFVGAPQPPLAKAKSVLAKPRNAQRSGELARLADWDENMVRQLEACTQETLKALGYTGH